MNLPEHTDWLDQAEQQLWFDRFKSADADGLRFNQFQEFLKATISRYLATFPSERATSIHYHELLTTAISQVAADSSAEYQLDKQQEMRLFKAFDLKNDHVIDRDEFGAMCSKWLHDTYHPSCGLVIVDVQNDFIDGSLALINGPAGQDGGEVVPVINDLIDHWQRHSSQNRPTIVYTQDWHPPDHIGFHANLHLRKHTLKPREGASEQCPGTNGASQGQQLTNGEGDETTICRDGGDAGRPSESSDEAASQFKYKKFVTKAKVFDTVLFDDGRVEQKLWPIHCVQNSWGAQLHPKLRQFPDAIRIQKGTLSHVDAYSAFWDNMRLNETGLRQELLAKQVRDLFFCGLALDFCVAASALDAAKAGFVTYVIEDACRGIDEKGIEARKRELLDNGVFILQSCHVKDYLEAHQRSSAGPSSDTATKTSLDREFIKTVALRKALN